MVNVTDEITISLAIDTPEGFLRGIDELAADAELRRRVLTEGGKMGALVFEDNFERIFAEGLVFDLAESLLKAAPAKLRAGETVHHLPFEDDRPVDLVPEGDTLTAIDLEKEISVAMPLQAALDALEAEAAAYAEFQRVVAEE